MTTYEQRQKIQKIAQQIKDILPDMFGSVKFNLTKFSKNVKIEYLESINSENSNT